jgi:hypothetical protein
MTVSVHPLFTWADALPSSAGTERIGSVFRRDLGVGEDMHHANYYYGHAHVLARYCGLPEPLHPPRIRGYLQHGWNIGDGLAPGVPFVEGSPLLVWSEQVRRRAWSQGRRDVVVVGSPFAYLL